MLRCKPLKDVPIPTIYIRPYEGLGLFRHVVLKPSDSLDDSLLSNLPIIARQVSDPSAVGVTHSLVFILGRQIVRHRTYLDLQPVLP